MKLFERPSGHYYKDKTRQLYPSVTTVLSSVKNEKLEAWKATTPNWQKISGAACVFGSSVHREIEHIVMGKHPKIKHKIQIEAFLEWQHETGFQGIQTELKVKSRKGFAGSLDLLGKIEDALYIIDLKTSKRIYPEMLLQLSAYRFAFEEMNSLINVNIGVLRIDKGDKPVEWHPYTAEEYNEGITEFLQLCVDWHQKHNIKTEFNKKFVLEE